jgi:hypothetical protein
VFPTSLGPKVIKDKAMEDVQRLPGVCEAAWAVGEDPRGVILLLSDRLAQ